ncbi:MAG: hypothetical protein LDL33_00135 [Desulfomonile sp.]|nr:hypothetical protein [Desulfomonile sp.]
MPMTEEIGMRPRSRWGYEWKSRAALFGIPLVHVAFGRDSAGRRRVAKGFIAIGRFAFGAITVAQFGVGLIFGLGQFVCGLTAVGQVAAGILVAIGQAATGLIAVGQVAAGLYALAQVGYGRYLWTPTHIDMEAVALFHTIYFKLAQLVGLE